MFSISVWNQYTKEEVIDYLKHSREYLDRPSASFRENFLCYHLNRIYHKLGIEQWKEQQCDLIVGMLIASARSFAREPLLIKVGDLLVEIKQQLNKLNSSELTLQYIVLI